MHIVIILSVIGSAIFFLLMRQRTNIVATDLSALELREFEHAIEAPRMMSEGQILVWSLCFVDSNPELDLSRITQYLSKKWNIGSDSSEGDSPLQRVITFGKTRLTLEPILVNPGTALPDQIVPEKPACVPNDAVGCILVTASTPGGGAQACLGLSQAVLALVDTCRQVNDIYWMSSEILLRKEIVRQKLKTNYQKLEWPVNIWVSSHAFRDEGVVTGYTVGLAKIGGTEFEALDARESPGDLIERLDGAVLYVVNHFGQIHSGDTIGVDEKERIRLTKAPSQTIHKGWVFQLQHE